MRTHKANLKRIFISKVELMINRNASPLSPYEGLKSSESQEASFYVLNFNNMDEKK